MSDTNRVTNNDIQDIIVCNEECKKFISTFVKEGPLDRMVQWAIRHITSDIKQAYDKQIEPVWNDAIRKLRSKHVDREALSRVGFYGSKLKAEKEALLHYIGKARDAISTGPGKKILALSLKAFKFINSFLKSLKAALPQMHIIEEFKEL